MIKMLKFLLIGCFVSVFTYAGTFAETNQYACEDVDAYPYINPAVTLCSTHAYNMGWENNDHSYAEIDEMKRVIGLKSTIMTQQMKRQYDNLEGILRKLKTQLQKSVLKANLEAAGGKSEDSKSGKSSDKSIVLAGAENCGNIMDAEGAFRCAKSNVSVVLNNIDSNRSKACKQLENTYSGISAWFKDPAVTCKTYNDTSCDSKDNAKTKAQNLAKCIAEEERNRQLQDNASRSGGWYN